MSRSDARQRILAAALDCFLADGVRRTTVEQIRARAEVSNGSFFHHFRNKDELAEAVFLYGLERHQAELLAVLAPGAGLRAGVEGVVRRHLAWVRDNRQLAAFLLGPPDWTAPRESPRIVACSRAFFEQVARWLGARGWDGSPPLGLVVAIWVGPAQEYARRWLLGGVGEFAADASELLARAAWNALRPLLPAVEGRES